MSAQTCCPFLLKDCMHVIFTYMFVSFNECLCNECVSCSLFVSLPSSSLERELKVVTASLLDPGPVMMAIKTGLWDTERRRKENHSHVALKSASYFQTFKLRLQLNLQVQTKCLRCVCVIPTNICLIFVSSCFVSFSTADSVSSSVFYAFFNMPVKIYRWELKHSWHIFHTFKSWTVKRKSQWKLSGTHKTSLCNKKRKEWKKWVVDPIAFPTVWFFVSLPWIPWLYTLCLSVFLSLSEKEGRNGLFSDPVEKDVLSSECPSLITLLLSCSTSLRK